MSEHRLQSAQDSLNGRTGVRSERDPTSPQPLFNRTGVLHERTATSLFGRPADDPHPSEHGQPDLAPQQLASDPVGDQGPVDSQSSLANVRLESNNHPSGEPPQAVPQDPPVAPISQTSFSLATPNHIHTAEHDSTRLTEGGEQEQEQEQGQQVEDHGDPPELVPGEREVLTNSQDDPTDVTTALSDPTPSVASVSTSDRSPPQRMADPPSNLPHPQQQQQPPPPVFGLGQFFDNILSNLRNVVRGPGQLSDESSPATSLPSRSEVSSSNTHTDRIASSTEPSHEAAEVGGPVNAQSDSSSAQGDQQGSRPEQRANANSGEASSRAPPVTLYFRLPFNGPDGNPALLAFTPTVVPNPAARSGGADQSNRQNRGEPLQEQEQRQQDGDTDQQRDQEGGVGGDTQGNGRQPNASPNAQGHVPIAPIFVPLGASPLPFSFIYDASTNLAWPIAEVRVTPPPNSGGDTATFVATATGAAQSTSRLVAGPPFRIALDLHFGQPPEPEQPDPERAARFVSGLEKADSELRSRMARLGMGDIGDYEGGGGHTTSEGQDHALLGCGICLERYEEEDRPEWIAGKASEDEAVVAVPCSGHHTLHAGCLRDWLAKTPPSQWSCPFCRAPLCKKRVEESASSSNGPEGQSFSSSPSSSTGKNCQEGKDEDAKVTTLREEVRHRERLRGWRCDAPACLPRYPPSGKEEKEESERECHSTSSCWEDGNSTRLVKLTPCKHEVHLDCLCTSMRVEADLLTPQEMEEEREDGGGGLGVEGIWNQNLDCFEARSDDEGEGGEDDQDPTNHSLRVSGSEKIADEDGDEICTVGKWVTCPTCRKESWANLPVRKRPRRRRVGGGGGGGGRRRRRRRSHPMQTESSKRNRRSKR